MFKQTLIGALLALGLAGAASAQEQAAVQMPDPEIVQRMQAPTAPIVDSGDFDAFGTPIPVPESKLDQWQRFAAQGTMDGPLPLAPDAAEAP